MNALAHHLTGDISPEHQRRCLARNVARWNGAARTAWIENVWRPKYGDISANALALQIIEARGVLMEEREARRVRDKQAGQAALAELRGVA